MGIGCIDGFGPFPINAKAPFGFLGAGAVLGAVLGAVGPSPTRPIVNFRSEPPTRATPTAKPSAFTLAASRSNSMTSIPHSWVICVFSEPSSFMDHTFATPFLSEMKKTLHGNAGVVRGAHAPRFVHASSVSSFASSSPSHQRHKRLCSPPS